MSPPFFAMSTLMSPYPSLLPQHAFLARSTSHQSICLSLNTSTRHNRREFEREREKGALTFHRLMKSRGFGSGNVQVPHGRAHHRVLGGRGLVLGRAGAVAGHVTACVFTSQPVSGHVTRWPWSRYSVLSSRVTRCICVSCHVTPVSVVTLQHYGVAYGHTVVTQLPFLCHFSVLSLPADHISLLSS